MTKFLSTARFRIAMWNTFGVAGIALAALFAVRQGVWWTMLKETDDLLTEDVREIELALKELPAARFLQLTGKIVESQQFTIFAVAADRGRTQHRAIFSNWDGAAGNSVTSLFLGLTDQSTVRLSDAFGNAGQVRQPERPFLLTAVSGDEAAVFQNGRELAKRSRLPERDLKPPYVIGQQGNINGEYWTGDIAALLVFNRALDTAERTRVEAWLLQRYSIKSELVEPPKLRKPPEVLALESLCHVLLNTNEFLYRD